MRTLLIITALTTTSWLLFRTLQQFLLDARNAQG